MLAKYQPTGKSVPQQVRPDVEGGVREPPRPIDERQPQRRTLAQPLGWRTLRPLSSEQSRGRQPGGGGGHEDPALPRPKRQPDHLHARRAPAAALISGRLVAPLPAGAQSRRRHSPQQPAGLRGASCDGSRKQTAGKLSRLSRRMLLFIETREPWAATILTETMITPGDGAVRNARARVSCSATLVTFQPGLSGHRRCGRPGGVVWRAVNSAMHTSLSLFVPSAQVAV